MNPDLIEEANRLSELDERREGRIGRGTSSRTIILPGQTADDVSNTLTDSAGQELHFADSENISVGVEVMLELEGIKSSAVIADTQALPSQVEGLLLKHRELPLCGEQSIILTADDHEVVREIFILPTDRRSEVCDAHRHLSEISEEFVTDSHKRDMAMTVFYPALSEEVDLWYRIEIDEHRLLTFAIHIGPSHRQEIKKKIEGTLQL